MRLSSSRGEVSLPVAVCVVRGDVQGGLLAGLHGDDALVPALDDATDTDGGLEVAAADRGVEPMGRASSAFVFCFGRPAPRLEALYRTAEG